ncbi:MAG TPA: hypothetical protein VGS07_31235 [Thermoanaerobaculia bacterium]|jgi:hypothetical protein|nr:hypothetical protein [Thermoanaerobaculia bacterium]
MAALTLEITSDLESALRREATKQGLDTQGYILRTLRERLTATRQLAASRLPADEAALLQTINQGFSSETWQHYASLKTKRRAGTLKPSEQAELIALSDQMEEMNVRRMESVSQLARLRKMSVDVLMEDLGIKSSLYE